MYQKCIKNASKVHQKCIKMDQKCIKSASKMYQKWTKKCIEKASVVHDAFNRVQSSLLKCIEKASGVHDAFDRASIIFIKTLQIIKHRSKKISRWNWKWGHGLNETSLMYLLKPAKGWLEFHPNLLQSMSYIITNTVS